MKKKVICILSALTLAVSLCGCADSSGTESSSSASAAVSDKSNVTGNADAKESENPDAKGEEKNDLTDDAGNLSYADIYTAEVEKLSSSGDADLFALVYVDDDEIPELVAVSSEGSWDKDQVFLYTADGKEAVLLASDIAPGMEGHFIGFFEKENVFVKSGASMGNAFTFCKIENSKPLDVLKVLSFQMIDDDDNEIMTYMVDENEVTSDEYNAALKEAIPSGKMTKLAEVDSTDMVSYNVSIEDGYIDFSDAENTPYYSADEILEKLAE